MTTTAVLGTGTMGSGMARSLLRAGHDVRVWNRTAARAEPLARDGATVCASVREAVDGADVVVVVLFDEGAVHDVLAEVETDAVVLQCSTIGVQGTATIGAYAAEKGLRLLDSPVLGTKKPADDGTLTVLVSGDHALVEQAAPVLDAIGAKTVVAGDAVGAASALKLACNAWVATITAATAQSIELAKAQGLDPALFLDAIDGSAADSPYAHVKGDVMIAGGSTDVSFALDGLRKDVDLMLAAAGPMPTTLLEAVRDVYADASAKGHGQHDIGAVVTAFQS